MDIGGSGQIFQYRDPPIDERRAAQAKERRRARDADVSGAQMAAALNSGGVSWGFGEDAEEEEGGGPDSAPFVDWRNYFETKGLTDKQASPCCRPPLPPGPIAALQPRQVAVPSVLLALVKH